MILCQVFCDIDQSKQITESSLINERRFLCSLPIQRANALSHDQTNKEKDLAREVARSWIVEILRRDDYKSLAFSGINVIGFETFVVWLDRMQNGNQRTII